jgi:hypothetical protein
VDTSPLSLLFDEATPGHYWIHYPNAIWETRDGGASFERFRREGVIVAAAVDPGRPGKLAALTDEGVVFEPGGAVLGKIEGGERLAAIAVDGSGRVHVGGGRHEDLFLARLNPEGEITYFSYFGGRRPEDSAFLTVLENGNVVLLGRTRSPDVAVAEAFQPAFGGGSDLVLLEVTGEGALVRSSYLGGSGVDFPLGVAKIPGGGVAVTAETLPGTVSVTRID